MNQVMGKEKMCQGSSSKKVFGEKLLSIMLKNNSLIKITGKMLDHNGKPVSFLQDFFFLHLLQCQCTLLYNNICGTVYVSFSKFILLISFFMKSSDLFLLVQLI